MNTSGYYTRYRAKALAAVAVSLVLAACAAAPSKSQGAADARAKLTVLQSDANLASRAPVAIKEAEAAVVAAEAPQTDEEQAAHLAYLADRKVAIARARAESRLLEDQRAKLAEQRDSARLDARTREADTAKAQVATAQSQVATAQAEAVEQKHEAEVARTDADAERVSAAAEADAARTVAAQQAGELRRQIDDLQAKATDRGLVLTLGDVLFASGMSDLNAGATSRLEKLASFLNQYPDRSAAIEGHTDSVGGEDYNLGLSQRRADSVKSYLAAHGVGSVRLAAAGKGETQPLAGNDSATGRQQNRRVEVIIDNPPPVLR